MNLLTELANKYGTDKGTTTEPAHGYTEIYHQYLLPLRGEPLHLLEIGVASGASIRMWKDYFPKGHITGIDHNSQFVEAFAQAMVKEGNQDRLSILDLDVTHKTTWGVLRLETFDVIIDDGGHYTDQIVKAFDGAWPLLRSGGFYFIEDLHQIYHQEHSPYTALDWLDKHITRDRVDERGRYQSAKRVESACDVEFIHRYKSLAILRKR